VMMAISAVVLAATDPFGASGTTQAASPGQPVRNSSSRALGRLVSAGDEAGVHFTGGGLLAVGVVDGGSLPAEAKLRGRVTDEAGKPLGHVRYRISAVEEWGNGQWKLSPPNKGLVFSGRPSVPTDGEGRFGLEFPGKVRYDLQFDRDGYAPVFLYQVGPEAGELHVIMKEGVAVRGAIVRRDAKRRSDESRLVVKLRFPSRDIWFETSTHVDAEGRFEFPHVSPATAAPGWKEPAQWQIVCLGKVLRIDVVEGKPLDVRLEISEKDVERDYRERGGRPQSTSRPGFTSAW